MRILYISSSNSIGGSGVALLNIIRVMKARGHEILVATSNDNGPLLEELDKIGCKYVQLSVRNSIYPMNWNPILFLPRLFCMIGSNMKAKRNLKHIVKEFSPDLVHTNVGTMNVAVDICRKARIPHIWHHREYQDLDFNCHFFPTIGHYLRQSHHKNNYNISITKGLFLYRNFRKDVDRVIYDGVFPASSTATTPITPKQKYVLFVGRVEPAKGLLDLVRVFANFLKQFPDYKLLVAGSIGDRKYYAHILELAKTSGTINAIEFLGIRTDVYDLMAKAKMLVVPSRFEGFGFITTEAMLNYCPVVGRNTGGTKEQFDRGVAHFKEEIGLRFSNDQEMLERMCQVVNTDVSSMCQRAKEMVAEYYTSEYCVNQIEEYYHFVLQDSKKRKKPKSN